MELEKRLRFGVFAFSRGCPSSPSILPQKNTESAKKISPGWDEPIFREWRSWENVQCSRMERRVGIDYCSAPDRRSGGLMFLNYGFTGVERGAGFFTTRFAGGAESTKGG